jgi:hypothetical protein
LDGCIQGEEEGRKEIVDFVVGKDNDHEIIQQFVVEREGGGNNGNIQLEREEAEKDGALKM